MAERGISLTPTAAPYLLYLTCMSCTPLLLLLSENVASILRHSDTVIQTKMPGWAKYGYKYDVKKDYAGRTTKQQTTTLCRTRGNGAFALYFGTAE